MILHLELKDQGQLKVIRAFLDALKIKHTIQDSDIKMTKEAYFEMLESSMNEAKNGKSKKLTKELRNSLFA